MDFKAGLQEILHLLLTGVLPLLVVYVINFLRIKIKEQTTSLEDQNIAKHIKTAVDVIGQVVIEINQTYVDELKKNGTFTKESEREAKEKAVKRCKQLISEKSKEAIEIMYNDFDVYLNSKIEELVNKNKD